MNYKFATRNFLGNVVKCYLVDVQELPAQPPTKQRIGHHIIVVDASGSMYGDIADVKEKIRKMLTLDEYRDSEMLVSLLSYSSSGDLVNHFERVKVSDIVRSRNTKAQREIGSLKARGMTCMTQALEVALKLAKAGDKDELTAISLHTDGYFNDPSPTAEFRKIGSLIDDFKQLKNAFVNTIGYRDYCDFPVLEKIANAMSGKCWRARDIKTFYDSIYDTTALLAGQTAPAIVFEKSGKHDYQVFTSSDGKIVGGADELRISGVKADAVKGIARFKEVERKEFEASKAPALLVSHALAFAKSQLAEGRVNAAKYAVAGAGVTSILGRHARALAPADIAAFADDLERAVNGEIAIACEPVSDGKPMLNQGASVPAVLEALSKHREHVLLDIESMLASYKRRGLKRLVGEWENGRLLKPHVRTELRDKDKFIPIAKFEFNRNNATINMMIAQPCRLVLVKDGSEVREAAGLKLSLTDYKQYTLVGDGSVNVPELRVRVTNKIAHRALAELGAIADPYDPKQAHVIDLANRPLVDYGAVFMAGAYDDVPGRLARLHATEKLFSALVKGQSAEMSREQVDDLKKLFITPKLYVSVPTANPYTDLKQAIADGDVDVRISYDIFVGNKDFLNPSDLRSANEFLARWYECEGVADEKKPKMHEWFNAGFKAKHKKLSARTKVGPDDTLMADVFDAFLGLSKDKVFTGLEKDTDVGVLRKWVADVVARKAGADESAEMLAAVEREMGVSLNRLYREVVSPLVQYIGSSGLIPDDFGDAPALSAEQLLAKYPDASLTKAMKDEGTFYDLGHGVIVTIVRNQSYFSTEKGLETAKKIEAAAVARVA